MERLSAVNLGVRFLLELCLLAALCDVGFHASDQAALRWLLGLGLPVLAALVWGRWIAPKSRHQLRRPARLGLEVVLFGGAVAGLFLSAHRSLSVALAAAVLVNELLLGLRES